VGDEGDIILSNWRGRSRDSKSNGAEVPKCGRKGGHVTSSQGGRKEKRRELVMRLRSKEKGI